MATAKFPKLALTACSRRASVMARSYSPRHHRWPALSAPPS